MSRQFIIMNVSESSSTPQDMLNPPVHSIARIEVFRFEISPFQSIEGNRTEEAKYVEGGQHMLGGARAGTSDSLICHRVIIMHVQSDCTATRPLPKLFSRQDVRQSIRWHI
jgi:hypothetical protein